MSGENMPREKGWRQKKWRGIMLSESTVDEYVSDIREDTKGQYITQGVSFNKDDALQMNLFKQTLLTHSTFSGFVKHLLYNYFANEQQQKQQINVQQQFILQQNRNQEGNDGSIPTMDTVVQKDTKIQGNPEYNYANNEGYAPIKAEDTTVTYRPATEVNDGEPKGSPTDMRLHQDEIARKTGIGLKDEEVEEVTVETEENYIDEEDQQHGESQREQEYTTPEESRGNEKKETPKSPNIAREPVFEAKVEDVHGETVYKKSPDEEEAREKAKLKRESIKGISSFLKPNDKPQKPN